MLNWDEYFIQVAETVAVKSKDRSTQVGAIIVNKQHSILSTGFNGFPRGIDDYVEERHERPTKYIWTEHAERNAIYNAAYLGHSLKDAKMYTTLFPCVECTRAIIQSGIVELVCPAPQDDGFWAENMRQSFEMLREAEINVRFI